MMNDGAAEASPSKRKIRPKQSRDIKLGLYSITYGGIWYSGPCLTFEEFVRRAKQYGYDGVELDNKRPMGSPLDLDQRKRDEMRNLLEREGMELPCVAANNDFSSPIPEHRTCQLLMVKETARLAADLGAKFVRLFAAWPGVPIHNGLGTYELVRGDFYEFQRQFPYATWLDRWVLTRDCLAEAAAYGEEFGVTMLLQNHAPLIRHWKDCYELVTEVDSPWLQVCLDHPIMVNYEHDWVRNAVMTVGDLQKHSHYGGEFYRDEEGKVRMREIETRFGRPEPDYPFYIDLMRETGYEGYFTFELCHPVLGDKKQPMSMAYVDEQAEFAQEFMRDILNA
jgi:sugar phosphate isomerase/epimerase